MKKIKIKYIVSLATLLLVVGGSFLIGHSADATLGGAVAGVLGKLIEVLIWILGKILVLLIYILIKVAQYNDFVNSEAVKNGWTIVRDLCNMFFILILLIIAFATILRMESYNWKKMLPKLLIMAVLINFSKTICGIFIDFAQVIMLTFVNGFKDMGGANFTEMLGLKGILSINTLDSSEVTFLSVTGTYVLALIYVLISIIVIGVLLAVLIMRMVMLWIYIVLSPLAYLLSAFPQGQKYASQWWGEFSKNVIVGPVLAFFIWLSLVSLGTYNATGKDMLGNINADNAKLGTSAIAEEAKSGTTLLSAGISEAGKSDNMIKFIISIGMLIGGLMVTQQIGGAAGSAAGRGMAAIQKGKGFVLDRGGKKISDATGFSTVQSYFKQRTELKEGARQDRIAGRAASLGAMVDVARGKSLGVVKNQWNKIGGGAEAVRLRKENETAHATLNRLRSDGRGDNDITVRDILATIKKNEDKAKGLETRQKRVDTAGKLGLGGVAAFTTGGLGGVLAGLAYVSGRAGLKYAGEKAMSKAGTDTVDGKIASKYRNEKVSKEMDKLKDSSHDEVKAILSNENKTPFERMAALLESMNRKIIGEGDVKARKEELLGKIGRKDNEFSDKKLNSRFEAIAIRSGNIGATNSFSKIKGGTDQAKNARFEIEQGIADGAYKMDDVGSETLREFIGQFAKVMDAAHFERDYDKMGEGPKKIVIEGLEKLDASHKEAQLKLALLTDFGKLDTEEKKNVALGDLTLKQISNIIAEGNDTQKKEFFNVVGKDIKKFSGTIQKDLEKGTSPVINQIREFFELPKNKKSK